MKVTVLNENRENHFYYHYTTPAGLIGILNSNKFLSQTEKAGLLKGQKTVSLSRDKNPKFVKSPAFVRITVDANKINFNNKIVPFNFYKDYNVARNEDTESEEAVLGDIKNAKRCITAIDIVHEVFYDDKSIFVNRKGWLPNVRVPASPREYFEVALNSKKVFGITDINKEIATVNHNINSYDKFISSIPFKVGSYKLNPSISAKIYSKAENPDNYTIISNDSSFTDKPLFIFKVNSFFFGDSSNPIDTFYFVVADNLSIASNIINDYFSDDEDVQSIDFVPFNKINKSLVCCNFNNSLLSSKGFVNSFFSFLTLNVNYFKFFNTTFFIQNKSESSHIPISSIISINKSKNFISIY